MRWLRRHLCVLCWRWAGANLLCPRHRRPHAPHDAASLRVGRQGEDAT